MNPPAAVAAFTRRARAPRVRPGLWLLLAACAALSVWAWLSPAAEPGTPLPLAEASLSQPVPAMQPASAASAPAVEPVRLGAVGFDPFAGVAAAASVPKPAPPVPQAVETPLPPPVAYRYLGRFTSPTGQSLVLLARDAEAVPVELGQVLDDGYRVERIDEAGVHLGHAPSGAKALIPLPPADMAAGPATVAANPR